ncbi:hypothetical protein ATY81_16725 [Rhizobium sp. R72]|nr:hypothetical protein ATY81_16725 [Rhizobium sp. R72]OWV93005.1 hypothetical protein ATY80_16725 [Rhizobium sp. R711]
MAYRASGLNLVISAIMPWNTVYLSRAVDYVRGWGIVIPDELLSQVAPLPWAHIALSATKLTNPSNVSVRSARTGSIQTTSPRSPLQPATVDGEPAR